MESILHLNEFFVEGGDQKISHVLLHVTEPSTPEEKAKGYFFALIELNGATTETITRMQSLIDDIENSYYEIPDNSEKTALELAIESYNAPTLSDAERASAHCLVGALRSEEILLAHVGDPLAVLFYRSKTGTYTPMELLEKHTEANDGLFNQFVQGKLGVGDYVFLGTPHVAEHFSNDRISKILTTRSGAESAEHFERVLGDTGNQFSFGGLIINRAAPVETEAPKKTRPVSSVSSEESIQHLMSTERATSQTLSHSIIPKIESSLRSNPLVRIKETPPRPAPVSAPVTVRSAHLQQHRPRTDAREAKRPRIDWNKAFLTVASAIGRGIASFTTIVWLFVVGIFRFFGSLIFIATNFQGRRRTILENWRREWRSRRENIRSLPSFTKIIFGLIALGLVSVVVGILLIQHSRTVAAAAKQFNDTADLITLKHDAAESALIYRDEPRAQTELQSAKNLFATLPCTVPSHKTVCETIEKSLGDLSLRLSKRSTVASTLLTTWTDAVDARLSDVVRVGNTLLATASSSSKLFLYDLTAHTSRSIETGFAAGSFTHLTVPKEADYVLAIVNARDIYVIDTTDWHLKKAEITFANTPTKLTAATIYSRRLYAIDSGANRVTKHNAIKNGFGPGSDWLAAGGVVRGAVDSAIDGDLYVLNGDGTVNKFTGGVPEPFQLPAIDPPLTSASAIYTYTDVENLYILDAITKRLIVLTKDGQLKAQLVGAQWENPTDFVVDEPNYTVYVVDGNRLFKIDLPR